MRGRLRRAGVGARLLPLLAALLGCALGPPPTSQGNRAIVGGTPSGGDPAVAALMTEVGGEPRPRCTAVLIAPSAALTAAHCLAGATSLAFGADAATPTLTVPVVDSLAHPLWVGVGNPPLAVAQANDIAVLLLGEPVTGISPLPLPSPARATPRVGEQTRLVGYGATAAGGNTGLKRAATARVAQVGEFELRVGLADDGQACDGDSGGPALIDGTPIGLVSRTVAASPGACTGGAIYTRLDAYLDFVNDRVELPCGSGQATACPDGSIDGGAGSIDGGAGSTDSGPPTATGAVVSGTGAAPRPQRDDGCGLVPGRSAGRPANAAVALALLALALARRRRSA